jgi:hypothetical protein
VDGKSFRLADEVRYIQQRAAELFLSAFLEGDLRGPERIG